jgi:hypothetical protein
LQGGAEREGNGYIGAVATLTFYDRLKRENGVKEAKINAEAVDLGLQLTKAKAAAGIKNSYLELQRSRLPAQLAPRAEIGTHAKYPPRKPQKRELKLVLSRAHLGGEPAALHPFYIPSDLVLRLPARGRRKKIGS